MQRKVLRLTHRNKRIPITLNHQHQRLNLAQMKTPGTTKTTIIIHTAHHTMHKRLPKHR